MAATNPHHVPGTRQAVQQRRTAVNTERAGSIRNSEARPLETNAVKVKTVDGAVYRSPVAHTETHPPVNPDWEHGLGSAKAVPLFQPPAMARAVSVVTLDPEPVSMDLITDIHNLLKDEPGFLSSVDGKPLSQEQLVPVQQRLATIFRVHTTKRFLQHLLFCTIKSSKKSASNRDALVRIILDNPQLHPGQGLPRVEDFTSESDKATWRSLVSSDTKPRPNAFDVYAILGSDAQPAQPGPAAVLHCKGGRSLFCPGPTAERAVVGQVAKEGPVLVSHPEMITNQQYVVMSCTMKKGSIDNVLGQNGVFLGLRKGINKTTGKPTQSYRFHWVNGTGGGNSWTRARYYSVPDALKAGQVPLVYFSRHATSTPSKPKGYAALTQTESRMILAAQRDGKPSVRMSSGKTGTDGYTIFFGQPGQKLDAHIEQCRTELLEFVRYEHTTEQMQGELDDFIQNYRQVKRGYPPALFRNATQKEWVATQRLEIEARRQAIQDRRDHFAEHGDAMQQEVQQYLRPRLEQALANKRFFKVNNTHGYQCSHRVKTVNGYSRPGMQFRPIQIKWGKRPQQADLVINSFDEWLELYPMLNKGIVGPIFEAFQVDCAGSPGLNPDVVIDEALNKAFRALNDAVETQEYTLLQQTRSSVAALNDPGSAVDPVTAEELAELKAQYAIDDTLSEQEQLAELLIQLDTELYRFQAGALSDADMGLDFESPITLMQWYHNRSGTWKDESFYRSEDLLDELDRQSRGAGSGIVYVGGKPDAEGRPRIMQFLVDTPYFAKSDFDKNAERAENPRFAGTIDDTYARCTQLDRYTNRVRGLRVHTRYPQSAACAHTARGDGSKDFGLAAMLKANPLASYPPDVFNQYRALLEAKVRSNYDVSHPIFLAAKQAAKDALKSYQDQSYYARALQTKDVPVEFVDQISMRVMRQPCWVDASGMTGSPSLDKSHFEKARDAAEWLPGEEAKARALLNQERPYCDEVIFEAALLNEKPFPHPLNGRLITMSRVHPDEHLERCLLQFIEQLAPMGVQGDHRQGDVVALASD